MRILGISLAITLSLGACFSGLDDLKGNAAAGDAGSESDGASNDAAIGDASEGNDASDGATVIACPPGAIFCDDFESGDFSKWDGTASATAPSVFEVTPKETWRGSGAMHVLIADPADSGTPFAFYATKNFSAVSTGDIAIRAYVRTPAQTFYGSFFVLGHGPESGQTIVIGPDNDMHCPMGAKPCINAALVGGSDWNATAGIPFPDSKYVCFELVVSVGPSGHVAAYIDGNSILQQNENTADTGGGYTSVSVGFSGALAGEEVFMDDVAIASKRIGCE